MRLDLEGRVKNISEKIISNEPYMPLYESIINSIEAIEESKIQDGEIRIRVIRDNTIDNIGNIYTPIRSFEIIDNGIGFNDENFESFKTSDTTYKINLGGKGIGRFIWLKAFERVDIKSVYLEGDNKLKRIFTFNLKDEISNVKKNPSNEDIFTSVKLVNFKEKYRRKKTAYKSPDKIAQRILEYFLSFYIMDTQPSIIIEDDSIDEYINLNDLYLQLKEDSYLENIKIKDTDFEIFHLQLKKTHNQMNKIVYCAHSREVIDEKIDFSGKSYLTDSSGDRIYYSCYVSSKYLDDKVDDSRQSFSIPYRDSEITRFFRDSSISLESINREVKKRIKKRLKSFFDEIKKQKKDKIQTFKNKNPQAINILTMYHKEILEELKVNATDKEVNDLFYKYKGISEFENMQVVEKILSANKDEKDLDDKIKELYDKLEKSEKDQLIHYMIYRRCIIDLIQKRIEVEEGETIPKEANIHNLIFPMRNISDTLDDHSLNLWILDEKLVFHNYAASDLPISKIMDDTSSKARPDILVCTDTQDGIVKSVSLIEFKRQFTDKDDPIQQLYNYVNLIRDKQKFKDKPIRVNETTIYYCYAICDINKKVEDLLVDKNFTKLPLGMGYFQYNPKRNVFMEVRAYDQIYNDVLGRHKSFFEKLEI
ncbi:hypothetical protein ES705_13988 [subsurface metagenome]